MHPTPPDSEVQPFLSQPDATSFSAHKHPTSSPNTKDFTLRHSFAALCALLSLVLLHLVITRTTIIHTNPLLQIGFGGNSGVSLQMQRNRKYLGPRLASLTPSKHSQLDPIDFLTCSSPRWAVFTTIFPPSPTIHQFVNLHKHGWCTVVVGDLKTPSNFSAGPGVLYVSPAMQRDLPFATVRATPWNHFGRKNLGYLIAIAGGARVIYDTDDDNVLINGTIVDPLGPSFAGIEKRRSVYHLFNPYSTFGGLPGTWPRGFPLEEVAKRGIGFIGLSKGAAGRGDVGVVQLLADIDPDLDAVYRMTGKLPLRFKVLTDKVYVPHNTLAPYNAQSTMVMPRAFWSLVLPITVPGRVSDIWRSYFYQPIMWNADLGLVFRKPAVNHIRSPHKLAADFQAELDLYSKSDSLTRYLTSHRLTSRSVPEQMEEQVIDMYEHGIVELQDVKLVQAWIRDLALLNYTFPKLILRDDAPDSTSKSGMHFEVHERIEEIISPRITIPATKTARKTLVIIMGYYRMPEVTWRNFEKHVLLPLNADLATVVSINAAGNYHDEFFLRHANFSLLYRDSKWRYRDALRQIAKNEKIKLNATFMDNQFKVPGNWLGCLEYDDNGGRQHAGSGICQVVNRYIAYLFLRNQLPHYDNIMIGRSDSLYYCAPNVVTPMQDRPFARLLPIHAHTGYNDRMYVLNRQGAKAMLRSAVFILQDELFSSKLLELFQVLDINHERILKGVGETIGIVTEPQDRICSYLTCSFDDQTRRAGCFFREEFGCFKYFDEPQLVRKQADKLHEASRVVCGQQS